MHASSSGPPKGGTPRATESAGQPFGSLGLSASPGGGRSVEFPGEWSFNNNGSNVGYPTAAPPGMPMYNVLDEEMPVGELNLLIRFLSALGEMPKIES